MYGLIGKKLAHSYSKEIHEQLHNEEYNLIELDKLDSFFLEKNFKGLNITIPYKTDVIKYCDELSELARRTQSVNSIVNNDGVLYGYNTDYDGLSFMLEYNDIQLENKVVLILGNGSTSRTIQVLCQDLNTEFILVSARNPKENEVPYTTLKNNQNIHLIFNATPVGMYPNNENSLNIDLDSFKGLEAVIDLIYNPLETNILQKARKKRIKYINGLMMLVHQAVKSSEIFHKTQYSLDITSTIYKSILIKSHNFVLIGMPMSGKSFFANYLAKNYNKKIIDIDKLIATNEDCTIDSIFKSHGESYFRSLETSTIKNISKLRNQAISTGGGTILSEINIDYLKQNGIIIFLDVPLSLLKTFNPKNRPLLKDKSNIERLYNERYNLYKKYADIIVIKDSYDETKTFSRIEAKIDEYFSS